MALFATNVSCVYLLSWVILHEQFVGVRVSNFKKKIILFLHENNFENNFDSIAIAKILYHANIRFIKYKSYFY